MYKLFTANVSLTTIFGDVTLTIDFGIRKDFTWHFVIADVTGPIIAADFLAYYGLLVNIRHHNKSKSNVKK